MLELLNSERSQLLEKEQRSVCLCERESGRRC